MHDKQVWEIIDKRKDMRILNMKWVFKLKNDGRYRVRVVAMGFRQLDGIDYHEAHAPVLYEVSLRLMLTLALKLNLEVARITLNCKKKTNCFAISPVRIDLEQLSLVTARTQLKFILNRA